MSQLRFVFLGLSITSSWGNGHATTYRGLVRELVRRGHDVLFLERDVPYYAQNRDLPAPPYGRTELYGSLEELWDRFGAEITRADAVIVGSYVPDGVRVGDWVTENARGLRAFYDIDTPITIEALESGQPTYIAARQIPKYDLYLSFTAGPLMERIRSQLGAPQVRPLYCSADLESYQPEARSPLWDLGYLGTYSVDRQPALDELLVETARRIPKGRFIVAGSMYPEGVSWPENVTRRDHVPPPLHRSFYCEQRYTLNITRSAMMKAGYSPSIRVFEAGACATPIISDVWPGVEQFFTPDKEILLAKSAADVVRVLQTVPERERIEIGKRGRERVLSEHTAAHRAEALEGYVLALGSKKTRGARGSAAAGTMGGQS